MTVSMITCPSCRTLLFTDTIVCPACRHILDAKRAALIDENNDLAKSRSEQIPCRNCGEANQIGLVRCWNCSTFLREDIQDAYHNMLRSQRQVIYSQGNYRPESESESETEESRLGDGDDNSDGDDGFELSGGYQLGGSSAEDSSETYSLNTSQPASSNGSKPPTTAEPAAEAASEPPSQKEGAEKTEHKRPPIEDDPDAEDHSVATGGDVLLDIALKEEKESEKILEQRDVSHRQKQVKKKSPPKKPSQEPPSAERLAAQQKALARRKAAQKRAAQKKRKAAEPKFGLWLADVHQHAINLQKLKLKPGSMEKLFEPVDVGCSAEGLILVGLAKKPGLFGKSKTKPEDTRKEVRKHLEAGKKKDELPAPKHHLYEADSIGQIKVVQPVVYIHESMFAGIPIFGEGRIAVRLPILPDNPEQQFLSFWLTEFRQFSKALEKYFQIKDLGILEGVPLTDPILELQCHYSEEPIKAVDPEFLKFYQPDPSINLELVGRRCEGCGLAVSEDARRKEKIGGLNGKAIAKAKCPKCEKKFGSISLFKLPVSEEEKSAEPDPRTVMRR